MKCLLKLLTLLLLTSNIYGQTIASCDLNDSIAPFYKKDADRMALRRAFDFNLSYKDSIRIDTILSNRYLKALIAVYNSPTIPARDTIVWLNIHSFIFPNLQKLYIKADSTLPWMENIKNNVFPCGHPYLDNTFNTYNFQKTYYWKALNLNPWHQAGFTASTSLNCYALATKVGTIAGVYSSEGEFYYGDGHTIKDTLTSNYVDLTYCYRWGDCIAGCAFERRWKFRVYTDCSVQYMGTTGQTLPPWASVREQSNTLNSIIISPNPVNEMLKLDLKNTLDHRLKAQIFNNIGQCVKEEMIEINTPEINVAELAKGVYYLKLGGNNGMSVIKFIKN